MNYKEIEKEATDWYSNQPMGSAVRQNGPAAIEAYIAATKIRIGEIEALGYAASKLADELNIAAVQFETLEKEYKDLEQRSISAPKGKKLKVNSYGYTNIETLPQ